MARGDHRAEELILQPYIEMAREAFVLAGLDRIERTVVRVDPSAGDGGRHFAACRTDGELIILSPTMVHLPSDTAMGIILHEFGHAADFAYPARIAFDKRGRVHVLDVSKRGGSVDLARWETEWETRSDDSVERDADRIAEGVSGVKIGYAGPCQLQTVGRGKRPRPAGLR